MLAQFIVPATFFGQGVFYAGIADHNGDVRCHRIMRDAQMAAINLDDVSRLAEQTGNLVQQAHIRSDKLAFRRLAKFRQHQLLALIERRQFAMPVADRSRPQSRVCNGIRKKLAHDQGRGLLEPSLIHYGRRFLLTLRAEDNRGYVCASEDGLSWTPKQPWAWDDGEPLTMSTTQQHWLAHSAALFLVYTRKDPSNVNVPRWRAPLWMAQVDTQTLRLLRATERIVLPLVGDGVNAPDDVAYSGNFHPVNVSPEESWVTDGEMLSKRGWKGDLLLARIRWAKPNKLVS